jgi:hypothetical protein
MNLSEANLEDGISKAKGNGTYCVNAHVWEVNRVESRIK